jgi:hypothetical protein
MDQRLVHVRGCGITPEDLTDCPLNHLVWPQLMAQQRPPTRVFFHKDLWPQLKRLAGQCSYLGEERTFCGCPSNVCL